ncbi:MAG: hypothetical protein ABIS45_11540 [Burkholderiales bacterium]
MQRLISTLLLAALAVTVSACAGVSKQYVISDTSGHMVIATSKPVAVAGTDLYVYWDRVGNLQTMRQAELGQVIER